MKKKSCHSRESGNPVKKLHASILLAATILAVFFGFSFTVSAQEQTVSCCIFFPRDGGDALGCGESAPRAPGDSERLNLARQKCDELKNEFRATKDVRFVPAVDGSSCRASPACAEPVPIAPLAEPAPTPPAAPAEEGLTLPEIKFRPPILTLPIPGIPEFSNVKLQGPEGQRYYLIPWLAQYLEAVYRYALSIIGIIATVMVVYGGVKWLVAAGDSGKITEAKKTITEAVIGLILALGSYLILFTINPEIVKFRALQIAFSEQATLPAAFAEIGDGEGETGAGAAEAGAGRAPGAGVGGCAHYAQDIRSQGVQCQAGPAMPSPTGRGWGCNYHTDADKKNRKTPGSAPLLEVKSLDVMGPYGTIIKAPIAGTVKLKPGKREDCRGSPNGVFAATCPTGNGLEIQFGNGYQYNMAHVSEFIVADGARVEVGQPIAKVGGKCCRELNGERFDTPEWKTKTSWVGHFWNDGCTHSPPDCRPPWETGNAPTPHVHISITRGESTKIPILACFK